MGQSVFLVRVFFSCLSSAQQWEHWVFGFFFFWVHFFVLFCVVFLPSQGRCTFPPWTPSCWPPLTGVWPLLF